MPLYRGVLTFWAVIFAMVSHADEGKNGNVIIDDLTVEARIEAKNGEAVRVKEISTYTLSASKADEMAVLLAYYDNESTTIDKASGQGGKPVYKAAETSSVFYSGNRVCAVPVQLKAGKSGKATFERTYAKPEFFCGVMPAEMYDIRRYTFNLHMPKSLASKVRISEHNLPDGAKATYADKGDETVYTLVIENVPSMASQPHALAPASEIWRPYVAVNACFGDVDALYAYLRGTLDNEDQTDPSVADLTAKVTAGMDSDMDKVDAIADWVRQNIRYVAIEHGEWGHRPDRADQVLAKRYGDCKGSANLIRAMLRAAGIDGRRVWIGTRNSSKLPWSQSCSLHSGNHMIAAAVLPDTTVFIDGTVKFAPHGYLPYGDSEQEVIIENGDGYILTTLPPADNASNLPTYKGAFDINGSSLSGPVEIEFGGSYHIMAQSIINDVTASRRESVLTRLVCFDRKGMTASDISVTSNGPNANETTITAQVADANGVKTVAAGAKLYVSPRPLRFFVYEPFASKGRVAPFDCGTPYNYLTEITIKVPDGYEPEQLPKRVDVNTPWFEGWVEFTAGDDGDVVCSARMRTISTEGPGSSLEAWNNAVRDVNKASNTPLILLQK